MLKKTALIIGGTGLVGKILTQRMLELGMRVFLVSRDVTNLPANVVPIKADIFHSDWVNNCTQIVTEVDVIIYAAYSIRGDESYDARITLEGLKEIVASVKAKQIVFLSSVGVFGSYPEGKTYNEESAKKADTPYQKHKIEAEEFLKNLNNISVCILYLTIVYSKNSSRIEEYRKLLDSGYLIYKKNGEGFYNILHAEDAAEAVICCLSSDFMPSFSTYIVGGESVFYRQWIELLDRYFGYNQRIKLPQIFSPFFRGPLKIFRKIFSALRIRVPLLIPEPKASIFETKTIFSSEKITKEFGWKPTRKIEEIFRK